MARKATKEVPAPVKPELADNALAKAVCDGDIVNFRFLFAPFSPARDDSSEQFETDKYAYLLPDGDQEQDGRFKDALAAVRRVETHSHILKELAAKRPPHLPSELLVLLGDNGVRAGKYTSAAQAYELLRVRKRTQEEFFSQADAALDSGDVPRAVRGYLIATGLEYDYAAFPEPLPSVPDYQIRALMLLAEYPEDPRDCMALQDPEVHIRTALTYLLRDTHAAARLDGRPLATQVAFVRDLVTQLDSDWPAFAVRYREACEMAREFGERLERGQAPDARRDQSLAEEIEETFGEDPRRITAHLLDREIPDGEWWQYLKDLAYKHPAAVLFVARLAVGDYEILAPRYRPDSSLAQALGLADDREAQ